MAHPKATQAPGQDKSTKGKLMLIRFDTNEHGTPISVHKCPDCGAQFTLCPPGDDNWGGCQDIDCPSYDADRDADSLFGGDERFEDPNTRIIKGPPAKRPH